MMRKFLCAVLLLALSACASLAASLDDLKYLNGELRIGMECAYAPNNWQEAVKSGTNIAIANVPGAYAEGYDVQFAAIIAKHLNLKPIIIKMDWDGLIEALNQGQIDVIIAGMMDTSERRQAINFSKPYHSTIYSMMLNKGSKFENAASIQDFKGASVLGQKDTALDTVIDQIEGVNHLAAVASVPDMIARLREGACDAIVINLENSKGYLASNPDFRLVVFEEGKGFKLPAVGSCVGIRKSDNALLELVDEALAAVDQDAREVMWETAVNKQPK